MVRIYDTTGSVECEEKLEALEGVTWRWSEEMNTLTAAWNEAYLDWKESDSEFLVISNNDVVFTPGWLSPLRFVFNQEDCGISGPMTNQPGHQRGQLLPIQDPLKFVEHSKAKYMTPFTQKAYPAEFVNGFCFCLRKDRLVLFDDENLFNPKFPDYGNEDEYQERMRMSNMKAYIMEDSRVFHFKDVSFKKRGDSAFGVNLPPRMKV